MQNQALERAITVIGGRRKVAELCGVSYSAVQQWDENGVPAKHVLKIEQATGGQVSRHELRDDIYGPVPTPDQHEARP